MSDASAGDGGATDAAIGDGGGEDPGDAGEPPPDEGSPWGIATSAARSRGLGWLDPMAAAGFSWLRGYDRGNAESSLDDAGTAGFEVTGILQMGSAFPADDLPGWEARVRTLVEESDGRVRQWEVWNEPPNFSDDKTPESYAAIVSAAYDVVKSIDPTLRVGICAASVHLNFMERALLAGAAGHFDYVTLHPYETLDQVDKGFEALFLAIVPTVRKMLRASSPAQVDVPIVFTEIGKPVQGDVTEERQADAFVHSYVLSLAQSVTRVHWFEGIDGDSGPFGLLANDGSERMSYVAARTLVGALGDRPRSLGWVTIGGDPQGFVFEGASGPVMVAWAKPGTSPSFTREEGEVITDLRSGDAIDGATISLTTAPIVVTGLAGSRVDQAMANRSMPYPWNGDFTSATSVSYRIGDEAGLHPLGASTVIAIGGDDARDCSGSPGQTFAVDPNFLTYDTVPLRVRAEVRRLGAGAAGFNLKYESLTGTSSQGWNGVPAGDEWHVLEWDLDDARFVGKWGYHLNLDSDSTANSGYALRSLVVEKR